MYEGCLREEAERERRVLLHGGINLNECKCSSSK
jgi:hypothetical protein